MFEGFKLNPMVKPIPNHGTLIDYERDVTSAQAAYNANPSSRNASDLHAAKEALERRQQ